ncbi:LPS assembly lipoprotein LptE [Govanella unica]|uniref:LPS assembly lipoprotein LptE n=1 Tax=Govanella unica TaxID=2975056 RepID=A0A9X3Z5T5_9PROT|nr:LPS assembly lipoprotein LptE [Govania unica]MDA5192451.1 LPS assembly lipoprotein LptE [Govania unica]
MARLIGVFSLAAALAACGFEPMYAPGGLHGASGAAADLAAVELAPLRNDAGRNFRVGQQMSNALSERLYASGVAPARYRLELKLTEHREGFGFRQDESVTRYGLRLSAEYRLIDIASKKTVLSETTQTYNSYDVSQSDFATVMAQRDMEQRLTRDLSDRIVSRLGLFFREPRKDAAEVAPQPSPKSD